MHPGVAVDSGVEEVEGEGSEGEEVEEASGEEEEAEYLQHFILACFGIHTASADFQFFSAT